VLQAKLDEAVLPFELGELTRRDAGLPQVKGKVHAIVGMRRVGKTTYLRQLQAALRASLRPEQVLYLSFDDDRLAGLPLDQLNALLEEYFRRYPQFRGKDTVHWLLDEVQMVPGWERFVRRVKDTEKMEIVVSGSSARMLSREVHTSLRGRGMETVIGPFSFREFLRHRGEEPVTGPLRLTPAARSRTEQLFLEYLEVGGFPEAQGLPPDVRVELLQGYVDTVLFRDILERRNFSQVAALRWLTRHCLRSPARGVSVHRLHQDLHSQGLAVSKNTLHAMLGAVEDAFLLHLVSLATDSERRRNSNPRKVYPADMGLIGAFDRSGKTNLGHALETAVLHALVRRKAEVGYVLTPEGHEVDFLARLPASGEQLLQVCADPSGPETLNREVRALEEAGVSHPRADKRLLVLTFDQLPPSVPPNVSSQTAYEWLLEMDQGGAPLNR
jgi:predicted AAA+ superfamily ATPase